MQHRKHYQQDKIILADGRELVLEGPVPAEQLTLLAMHPDLDAFRRPAEQHEALVEIAGLAEGRIILAREAGCIVGYVTFHYPDELERWSEGNMIDLVELGAVEVANDYRSYGLGKK